MKINNKNISMIPQLLRRGKSSGTEHNMLYFFYIFKHNLRIPYRCVRPFVSIASRHIYLRFLIFIGFRIK